MPISFRSAKNSALTVHGHQLSIAGQKVAFLGVGDLWMKTVKDWLRRLAGLHHVVACKPRRRCAQ